MGAVTGADVGVAARAVWPFGGNGFRVPKPVPYTMMIEPGAAGFVNEFGEKSSFRIAPGPVPLPPWVKRAGAAGDTGTESWLLDAPCWISSKAGLLRSNPNGTITFTWPA